MPQVVQAKCPNCANTLRIPAEWLAQPIRCKHCKQIFQMKARNAPTAITAAKVAQPVHATAMMPERAVATPRSGSNDPFGFDSDDAPTPTPDIARKPRKKGGGTLVLLGVFFFLFILGATGASFFVYRAFNAKRTQVEAKLGKIDGDHGADNGNTPAPGIDGNKTDSPKKLLPGAKEKGKKDGANARPFNNDPFPRRALLISVNGYLMFNPVHYGSAQEQYSRYPGSSTGVLRDRLTRPPMNFPLMQVVELSDGIPPESKEVKPHSTQKSVLETTIKDFVDTCREQDRIMIVFAGHGAYLEDAEPEDAKKDENKKPTGKAYLVPIDGNLKKPESLLTVKWVLNQLAQCKAQQKILVLDVFRFSPSRGFDMASPGEGEEGKMPEGFDKELENPPAGVQVWTACIKDQSSVELDNGSAFLQALCHSLQGGGEMKGISGPPQPIPIEDLVVKVNQRLKDLLTPEKRTQFSRLTGKSIGGVAYNRDEQLAAQITLKPPTAAGGQAASFAAIDNILKEIGELPPARETRGSGVIRADTLPAFAAKKIETYKPEKGQDLEDIRKLYKKDAAAFAKEFPLRAAYFEVVEALKESKTISMREVLASPINPKDKARFLQEQAPLGMSIFKLERLLASVKEAGEMRDMETSKRWLANFDYAQARLQSRLMYLFEYNYTLGQIRSEMPELAPGQSGWRVGVNSDKLNVPEKKARDLRIDTKKIWAQIQKNNEGTPWELLAQRESMVRLGLVWRPKSD